MGALPAPAVPEAATERHDEPALLANCYWQSLRLAARLDVHSIAFPAISGGVFGYPIPQAARIAVAETVAWQRTQALPARIVLKRSPPSSVPAPGPRFPCHGRSLHFVALALSVADAS